MLCKLEMFKNNLKELNKSENSNDKNLNESILKTVTNYGDIKIHTIKYEV